MRIVLVISIVVFSVNLYGQGSISPAIHTKPNVSIAVTVAERDEAKTILSVKVGNSSSVPVYIAVDPTRMNGSKGYYLSIPAEKSLMIASRVFGPSVNWDAFKDETSVQLKKLDPNEEHAFAITLQGRLTETFPPVELYPFKHIDLRDVRNVSVSIGYFVEDEGILKLLRYKKKPIVNGLAPVLFGPHRHKSLYEFQDLTSASVRIESLNEQGRPNASKRR